MTAFEPPIEELKQIAKNSPDNLLHYRLGLCCLCQEPPEELVFIRLEDDVLIKSRCSKHLAEEATVIRKLEIKEIFLLQIDNFI